MVTKGHRRLGRTIRILENRIELSVKESSAKQDEKNYKAGVQTSSKLPEDYPVQNLRNMQTEQKKNLKPIN